MKSEPAPVLSRAFRPFFLLASLWSALALALWAAVLMVGLRLPTRFDPLAWHIHAMLFGFVLAAMAGFMLTAVANWTGRRAIQGMPLAALAALWLTGRIACLISALMPVWVAAALDLAFPVLLCGIAAREIVAARNWRNLAMPMPIAVLGVADLLMHLRSAGLAVPAGLGWRLGVVAVIALISVVGGRIIPSFTRNWLVQRGAASLPAGHGMLDRLSLGLLHAALLTWAVWPAFRPLGVLLLLAAAMTLWRMVRWRGMATVAEPLLVILHIGYLWIVVGTALLGTSMLNGTVPAAAAIHALTAGAIGTMVLAVMTRVSLGHTGRPLTADGVTTLIYLLVILAAASRIAAEIAVRSFLPLIETSAVLWAASFVLFAVRYGPLLLKPAPAQCL